MNARHWVVGLLGVVAMIAVAACGGTGGDGGGPGGEKENLSLSLQFGSNDVAAPQSVTATPMGVNTSQCDGNVAGYLLVVPRGGDTAEQRFQFCVQVDLSKAQIYTYDLPLEKGTYNIYVLLNTPGRQFGGIVSGQIIQTSGVNPITVLVNPILSSTLVDLDAFRNLGAFVIDFSDKLSELAGFKNPRFGISIDGSPELYFNIFVDPANPKLTLFTSAGEHNIVVRFFDGAVATDSTPPGETTTVTTTDQPPQIRPEALISTVNYSASASTSTFEFTVPPDVGREAGVVSSDNDNAINTKIKTVVSLIGPEIELYEQEIPLTATRDTNNVITGFGGSLIVPQLFQNAITWQLRFADRNTGDLIAYCAAPFSGSGTFSCDLHLLVRLLASVNPPATLHVTVGDANGSVAGAVVKLNGEPIGVTGGGNSVGEGAGVLTRFFRPGSYPFLVTDSVLDTDGTTIVTRHAPEPSVDVNLDSGKTEEQFVTLPPFTFSIPDQPPPQPPPGPIPPPAPTPPTVVQTSPANGAGSNGTAGVSVEALINVRFSTAMDAQSVQSAFSMTDMPPLQASDFAWSDDGTRVTFTPPALMQFDHDYTVMIGTGAHALNDVNNTLANDYVFSFHTAAQILPPSNAVLNLKPARLSRPRRYADSWVNVESAITVRIPTMTDISVMKDESGNLLGDAERFLMVLHLGRVRCMYLGGRWDQHVGGFVERIFHDNFQSPVCNGDNLHGGSVITVNPGDGSPPRHRDDDGHGEHGDRPAANLTQIRARIISANPHFDETKLMVPVEVTGFTAPLPEVQSDTVTPRGNGGDFWNSGDEDHGNNNENSHGDNNNRNNRRD